MSAWLKIGLALIVLTVAGGAAAESPSRPDIVLIISDDHRWDGIGAAGNQAVKTPTLDRLATEGAYFPVRRRSSSRSAPRCARRC